MTLAIVDAPRPFDAFAPTTKPAGHLQPGDVVLNLGPDHRPRRVLGIVAHEYVEPGFRNQMCGEYVTLALQGGITRVVHAGATVEVQS